MVSDADEDDDFSGSEGDEGLDEDMEALRGPAFSREPTSIPSNPLPMKPPPLIARTTTTTTWNWFAGYSGDSLDFYNTSQSSESINNITHGVSPSGLVEWHQPDDHSLAIMPCSGSSFPKSAQMFVDAIKKNRACQKFLRSKLMQIEARIEENKTLKQRVKLLRDFQVSCKKRTGRALSQKKDARVQLISAIKPRANSKVNGKNGSPLYYGPNENSHVTSYRMVLKKFPISLNREKWSHEERENLAKGIKQQFQELLLQKSVDLISDVEGSSGDSNDFDSMIASIRDLDIAPETIRSFLPKVNWERLASMYVPGRSGAECEARTPFQCLARYQRSLNVSILKREWTEDDDDKLRSAVETFGKGNWQLVASTLEGRTGTQCSNRWIKSLHPARQRVGRWTLDEDKRLKVAVMLFGPKNWNKIAQFVPGRTHVQCRERWVNSLDPSLRFGGWTQEEDSKLDAAVAKHRDCWSKVYWSKVAACVPPRTDNQCKRRWRDMHPVEWSWLQAARKIQNVALISNFVDRESERPALGPNDFIPLAITNAVAESENVNPSGKQKRKSRSKRPTKEAQSCPGEVPLLTNGNGIENYGGDDSISKKRVMKPRRSKKNRNLEPLKIVQGTVKLDHLMGRQRGIGLLGGEKGNLGRIFSFQLTFLLLSCTYCSFLVYFDSARREAASMDDAISRMEREKKPYSKGNKHPRPRKAHLAASEKFSKILEVKELGGDHAAKSRKASERCRRESKCVQLKPVDSTQVDSSFCQVSTLSKITDVNEVEAFSDVGARNKNSHEPRSKRSKYNRLMLELLEISDSGEADTLRGNDASLGKKKVTKRSLKKCSGVSHSSSSKSCMIIEGHKRSRTTNKSISNYISEVEDGDDMTLASFIQNQRKKRKLNVAETGSFVVGPSAPPPGFEKIRNTADMRHSTNKED
ncbi:hypothetical protein C3L33_06807, partial [Rhododendron williamsianum]